MKFVANLLVAINNVAAAEAMVLGMKSGLDPRIICDMVKRGVGNSRVFELRAPLMAKGRYDEPSMRLAVWQKDMAVIDAHAKSLGCPVPLFATTRPIYDAAMAKGHGVHDTAVVFTVLEEMAGFRRGQRKLMQSQR
jgi:3-hydroxyisobutyrate dehydrogenase-like beta-hydroxyacid dehydrogenase